MFRERITFSPVRSVLSLLTGEKGPSFSLFVFFCPCVCFHGGSKPTKAILPPTFAGKAQIFYFLRQVGEVTGHNVESQYQSQWRTDTLSNFSGSVIMATAGSVTMAKNTLPTLPLPCALILIFFKDKGKQFYVYLKTIFY